MLDFQNEIFSAVATDGFPAAFIDASINPAKTAAPTLFLLIGW